MNRPPKKDANGELVRDENGFPVRDTDWYVLLLSIKVQRLLWAPIHRT